MPELHRRASEWYERNGLMEDAVHHALQTNDFDLATSLIERVAFSLWRLSKERTLLSWMKALPEELVRSHPSLSLHYAAALTVTGQLDAVEPWLWSVEAQLQEQAPSPTVRALLGHVYRLRAYVARFVGTPAEALAFSQQALEHTPTDRTDMRGVVLLHVGHAHFLNGDTAAANQALTEASATCRATGHPAAYLSSIHYLAQLRVLQGRLGEAMVIHQRAVQFVTEQDEPVFAGIEHIGVGDLLCERNDLEAASRHIQEGLRLAELGGDFVFLRDGYIASARLEQALGNLDSALVFLRKAEQLVSLHRSPWETALIEAWRARLWLAQGNLAAATYWASTCGLHPDDELCFMDKLGHLTLAQVLLAQGEPGKTGQLLARLLRAAESAGRMGRAIEILVWQALAMQAQNRIEQALQALERALILAEPEGYVRTFVDAGPPMTYLLRHALSQGIRPGYVNRLLSASGEAATTQSLIEPLTPREVQVLRLIVAGLRNREIADQLVISPATVKRHISNIYGKLGVRHRTQAVARAQELYLV
jgi:LuxR family maltose regulon positive regulatory protein